MKPKLNYGNIISAIHSRTQLVIRYCAGIIEWTIQDLQSLDRKTRQMFSMYGPHHPKADVDRLLVKRSIWGCGFIWKWRKEALKNISCQLKKNCCVWSILIIKEKEKKLKKKKTFKWNMKVCNEVKLYTGNSKEKLRVGATWNCWKNNSSKKRHKTCSLRCKTRH